MLFPAWSTMVSQRVHEADQSKCQAAVGIFSSAGIMLGVPVYNLILYDAAAAGMGKARPALVASVFSLLNLLLTCCTAALARQAPVDPSQLVHSESGSPSNASIPRLLPRHSQRFDIGISAGPARLPLGRQGCIVA